MNKIFLNILLIPSLLILANCASTETNRKVDAEVKAEPAHIGTGAVAHSGYETIQDSQNLTNEQKMKLTELVGRMGRETAEINEETSKLKGVLFETLVATPFKAAEVDVIKGRLLKLNDKKMKKMLEALREAEGIIGVNKLGEHKKFLRTMILPPAEREL
jgi:hypothetical protein